MTKQLILCLLLLPLWVHAQADGAWSIQGIHSDRGAYHGTLQINEGLAERKITYDHYNFRGYQVEEIWQGKVDTSGSIQFSLLPSHVLTRFEDFTLPADVFAHPQIVSLAMDKNFIGQIKSSYAGHYSEKYTSSLPGEKWLDTMSKVDITGDQKSVLIGIAQWLVIDRVVSKYRSLPEASKWSSRPEFKEQKQYAIVDHTDYDFYHKNSKIIRVTNQFISPLSLAEALQKRNAFAPTLDQKANFFDQQAASLNLNAAGLLESAAIDPSTGKKLNGLEENDSALWTTTYLLSQVLRYEKTQSDDAYNNARQAIDGIVSLVDVVPAENEFARTLMVSASTEKWDDNWVQGSGVYAHLKYKKGGNNDMFKGVALAFILAHRILKTSETELIAKIRRVAPKLLKLNDVKAKAFNLSLATGIQELWIDTSNNDDWVSKASHLGSSLGLDSGFYVGGMSDWSGNHLNVISTLEQILMAQEMTKAFPRFAGASSILKQNQKALHDIWKALRKARLGYVTILDNVFGDSSLFDQEFKADLEESQWCLREIPAPRTVGAGSADLTLRGDWSLSAYPVTPWKAIFKDLKFDDRKQGAYSYPLYEFMSWGSNYIWKDNPFATEMHSTPNVVTFSGDYLLVYWAQK